MLFWLTACIGIYEKILLKTHKWKKGENGQYIPENKNRHTKMYDKNQEI